MFIRRNIGLTWMKIRLCTTNNDYFQLDITNRIPTNNEWSAIEVEVGPYALVREDWKIIGNPDWSNITKLWLAMYGPATGHPIVWYDGIEFTSNCIRGAYTSDCGQASIENCKIGCIKHYGCRFLTIRDSLASTDTLDANNDSGPLAEVALYELLRNRIVRTVGQIQIPLDPTILPGQLTHIHAAYDVTTDTYKIDGDFRITSVLHSFTRRGAFTNLELTNDLKNSIPINTTDPYTVVIRAISPDYQDKTLASLKTAGDFIADQIPISKDYPK